MAVCGGIAVLLLRTWVVQGVVFPVVVVSNSMAPALLGPHWRSLCPECGMPFASELARQGSDQRLICPNCDGRSTTIAMAAVGPGERVVINRAAWLWRPPQRWEVVAFEPPDPSAWSVKRIVGLPGEAVQIRHGDIYINGRPAQKSLEQLRAMAVPVCVAATDATARRWQPEQPKSGWKVAGAGFRHSAGESGANLDWCAYHHQRWQPDGTRQPAAVDDDWAFNAALGRRHEEILPAADLLVEFNVVAVAGRGTLAVRMLAGTTPHVVHWEYADGRWTTGEVADVDSRQTASVLDSRTSPLPVRVSVAVCDGRLLAQLGRQPCVIADLGTTGQVGGAAAPPVAIGVAGLNLEIRAVRLSRDVIYSAPTGYRARWGVSEQYRLAADEYYLLGDNSPASEDSRSWPGGPGVPRHALLGRAWLAITPNGEAAPGRGELFQLPGVGRIRYIR